MENNLWTLSEFVCKTLREACTKCSEKGQCFNNVFNNYEKALKQL